MACFTFEHARKLLTSWTQRISLCRATFSEQLWIECLLAAVSRGIDPLASTHHKELDRVYSPTPPRATHTLLKNTSERKVNGRNWEKTVDVFGSNRESIIWKLSFKQGGCHLKTLLQCFVLWPSAKGLRLKDLRKTGLLPKNISISKDMLLDLEVSSEVETAHLRRNN